MSLMGGFSPRQVPFTISLIVAIGASFVLAWFTQGALMGKALMFMPALFTSQPWGAVTYPFASSGDGGGLIGVIFLMLWLWSIGAVIERELGLAKMISFWLSMTVLGAAFYGLGYLILGANAPLFGAFMPTAALTVAWGTRYPNTPVLLLFVLPVPGKWIAVLAALLVFFGTNHPGLAVFACMPLLLAYLWAAEKIRFLPWSSRPSARKDQKAEKKFVNFKDAAFERKKERDERERLRKLFESSIKEDPENKG